MYIRMSSPMSYLASMQSKCRCIFCGCGTRHLAQSMMIRSSVTGDFFLSPLISKFSIRYSICCSDCIRYSHMNVDNSMLVAIIQILKFYTKPGTKPVAWQAASHVDRADTRLKAEKIWKKITRKKVLIKNGTKLLTSSSSSFCPTLCVCV